MITQRTLEQKVMRDPVHEYIHIDYQIIWDVISAREFQRLRRIHQMGTSYLVYHTAEHSRFSHSLGVYEILRRMISEVEDLKDYLTEDEKIQGLLAGLLHDLGHGPFSHFFELVTHESHEHMTVRILTEDTEIHQILESYQSGLSQKVASILTHTHPKKVLSQLISSEMDADRMDYLLRDATFTGTSYGHFDLERILRTLRVVQDRLVIKESGIHSVEDYIMARYHMYWQVYFHPTSRAVEAILLAFFTRFKDLRVTHPNIIDLYPMFSFVGSDESLSTDQHYRLDESLCFYGFQCTSSDQDPILADLSKRLLDRRLFKEEDMSDSKRSEWIRERLIEQGFDPKYYSYQDQAEKRPYSPYNEDNHLIYVVQSDGQVKELSQVSNIVAAVVQSVPKKDQKIFYPKELKL